MVSSHAFSTLRKLSELIGVFSAGIGCLVLCGWVLDIIAFKSIFSGLNAMNPLSAICFILAGATLWLLNKPVQAVSAPALRLASSLMAGIGLIRLIDYTAMWNLGIDQLLFVDQSDDHRMAPFTAINFVCIGCGLFVFDKQTKSGRCPVQILGLFVAVTSFLILIGYAFVFVSFDAAASGFIRMPLNTALTFVLLGVGMIAAHPDRGIMAFINADHPGSYMLRRLLPVVVGLPFLLGWLRVFGQQHGWFDLETGATLYTVSSIAVISAIIWYTAKSVNKIDMERKAAEYAVAEANAQLRHTNIALKRADELKTDLLHIAAHDMKNPLGAIRTMTELIQSYPDDKETAQEMVGLIRSSADHMLHLIEELLRTAALESGTMELNIDYVELNLLVSSVVEGNTPQAQRKSQQIATEIEPRCTVEGDFSRLREAIDNLVSNAVKYSPEGGNIYITLTRNNGRARLEVRDEGPGLTDDDMKKLFGKFQRLRARPTGNESSTGLGLSIVKKLVELHNGKVWAESPGEGRGSTFYVELPAVERQQIKEEQIVE